jgi:DinB superfamily
MRTAVKGDCQMKTTNRLLALLLLLVGSGCALAQDAKPAEQRSIAQVLERSVAGVESEFVPAAEAMPEERYSFVPTSGEFKGVRTFAQQARHVAAVNYLVGAAILEEKPPVELSGENGPDSIKSKAEIVKFLKESFAYAHKAVGSINDGSLLKPIKSPFGEGTTTRLGMATLIVGHCFDHYGQMVEYLRMNNIIPPASR